jgi:tetrahedral aminopeptidase
MLLKELSEAIGVSGDEGAVRQIVYNAIKDHVTKTKTELGIEVDSIGNLTALQKGTNGDKLPRVMIAAHMDEIGFMVTGHESNGQLRFAPVGGVDDRILPGLRVKVGKQQIPGVIMWTPIHMNNDQNVTKLKDLRIDIGASNKSEAEGKVARGERVGFDSYYAEIDGTRMVRGKSFDDRVGCSVLIDVLQNGPYPVDIVAAFTVQEEVGLRGATVAAQRLKPDMAIVLEGTTAHDVPDPMAEADDPTVRNPATRVGQGPALTVMDRSMITAPYLLQFLKETAEAEGIPYQTKTALGGGTDAGRIHMANEGIPSIVISMPCRYIHSPVAFLSLDDYDNHVKLVQATLKRITADLLQQA